ncbi:MAG: NADH-quinone oxidoreductase subunit N [Elusimicrobiales bacterium]|nr:NADH-quinone oxidoreductase subunit N [Elusimicrobiales bacterium]
MNLINLNIQIIIPISLILASSFISLFMWVEKKNKNLSFDITGISMILANVFLISYINISENKSYIFSSSIFNNIAVLYVFLISTIMFFSHKEILQDNIKYGEYIVLYVITIISSSILISSDNLLTIFITIELMSVSLYALTGFSKTQQSLEASFKYLITGSFATFFFILSLIFIKQSGLSMELSDIKLAPSTTSVTLVGIFFLSGIFFKIALFPMHSWSIDVYCGSPTYVTSILTTFVKFSVLIVGYRVYTAFSPHIPNEILYFLIILTLIIPTISALSSNNIKKILIYSSISHAGYIGIGFFSSSNSYLYFYAIAYSIMSFGAFTTLFMIEKKLNSYTIDISSLKEIWLKNPILIIALSVFLFSLAGIPPFVGFFAKFYIFYSAVESSNIILAIIGTITSAIASYYYIKIIIPIFTTPHEEIPDSKILKENPLTTTIILFLLITTILLGIFSSSLIQLISKTI